MNEMKDAGLQVTMDENKMNVFVVHMTEAGPITPTMSEDTIPVDYTLIVIGIAAMSCVVLAVIILKKRNN
jgi:hypothetical protein